MITIEGVGISCYRSFGPEVQNLGPLKKINLLIGRNNVGKSNILNFLSTHYPNLAASAGGKNGIQFSFAEIDKHKGLDSSHFRFSLGIVINGPLYNETMRSLSMDSLELQKALEAIYQSKALTNGTNIAWFPYISSWNSGAQLENSLVDLLKRENVLPPNIWSRVWGKLTHQGQGSLDVHWIPETLKKISPAIYAPPTIVWMENAV